MTTTLFLYGTLCDPELFGIVAGHPLDATSATLADHRVFLVKDQSFPVILPRPGGVARGLLVRVDDETRARLDFYELGFGYDLLAVSPRDGSGQEIEALCYFPEPDRWPPGPDWSLPDWQSAHGTLTRIAAAEYMRLAASHSAEAAAGAFPMIRSRAASRLRAEARPSPPWLSPQPSFDTGGLVGTAQPYTDYFAVREDWLRFPRFDGAPSPVVKRATFMGGDAVTVLPYDPARDAVLVVRQFRHGAYARGDANPWCVEPPAGRIDPHETARDAAARELAEETGLAARDLIEIASYYPTPGAFSEHLTSFVAICDLSGLDGRTGGVEGEAEDIMSHVLPLDDVLAAIPTGQVNTGPLILSALWLARNRAQLRG